MSEEMEPDEQRRRLFGTLFGFKAGDRIKVRIRTYGYNKDGKWGLKFYWRYGTVKEAIEPKPYQSEERVRVLMDGDYYSYTMPISRLVRCRKYGRSK